MRTSGGLSPTPHPCASLQCKELDPGEKGRLSHQGEGTLAMPAPVSLSPRAGGAKTNAHAVQGSTLPCGNGEKYIRDTWQTLLPG